MKLCLSPEGLPALCSVQGEPAYMALGWGARDVGVNLTEAWLRVDVLRHPTHTVLKKERIFHMVFALLLYGVVASCAATDVHTGVV